MALGPFDRDHLDAYVRWGNDFEIARTFGSPFIPRTRLAREAWFERIAAGDPRIIDFTIFERTTNRPIGYTTLDDIDPRHLTARFGLLIGEKDCWGKGYGTETTELVLEYGFRLLGLHSISLTVLAFNERAYRVYRRAGFREIGHRRESHRLGSTAVDEVLMDCLASEFQQQRLVKFGA